MPTRRAFLGGTVAAMAVPAALAAAAASPGAWPTRPIRMVVGFPPGQSTDNIARLIAARLADDLKQTVYVDNKPGAAGIIAHDAVRQSPADGYTVLMGSGATLAINPALYRKLPYRPIEDFEPIGRVTEGPLYLYTATATPVANLKEMVAYANARPGKVSYGSSGNGTTQHIAMEMLKKATGMDLLHVPYKGAAAVMTDVIGGQVQFGFDAAPAILPMAKTGRVRLLGVTSLQRSAAAPDVPTLAEQGLPGFQALAWLALLAPKGTPEPVVQALNVSLNKALQSPEVQAQVRLGGSHVNGGTPADLTAFMRTELVRWGQAVKDSGAQVD